MKIVNVRDASVIRTRHGSEIRPLMDRTTSTITQCSIAEELLPPGHAVVPHFHRETEEVYYVLEGEGLMTVGDETCTVGSGDAILIPRNKVHSLANTGLSVMKIVLVCGPAFSRADENFLDGAESTGACDGPNEP
ncbi:MAG: cupin domain-containing protein [Blastocatellia bacterium]|nr:cupin domain-containing protein [Blastocatellia bacterium]